MAAIGGRGGWRLRVAAEKFRIFIALKDGLYTSQMRYFYTNPGWNTGGHIATSANLPPELKVTHVTA